jgi:hypothetical protein
MIHYLKTGSAASLLIVLFVFSTSSLLSSDNTDEKVVLIRRLFKSWNTEAHHTKMLVEMESALPRVIAATKGQTPKAADILKKTVERFKRECNWKAMEPHYITAYTDTMTEDDLRQAVRFFESECGKKYILSVGDASKANYDKMQRSLLEIFSDEQNED